MQKVPGIVAGMQRELNRYCMDSLCVCVCVCASEEMYRVRLGEEASCLRWGGGQNA